uniref:Aldo_ket_red domain-containing protein n=1 Tax=Ascaris lumbricoides TaxID=6252 RepID=A0A0M3I9R0_ASCLU
MVEETTANFLDKISSAADVNGTIDLQSDKAPTKVNARFYYCTSPFDLRDSAAKRAQEVGIQSRELDQIGLLTWTIAQKSEIGIWEGQHNRKEQELDWNESSLAHGFGLCV